jgi:hypothetical protein
VSIIVRIDSPDGKTLVQEQPWPCIPSPNSVVALQEDFRITDAPPVWQYKVLPNGQCARFVCVLTAVPAK